jgi:hypothetical protein
MSFDFEDLNKTLNEEFELLDKENKEEENDLEDENLEEEEEKEETTEDEVSEGEVAEEESEEDVEENNEEDEDLISEEELEKLAKEKVSMKRPTPEEKRNYAFEKLRKENKERKEREEELNSIAQAYGYTSHIEMIAALKEDAIKKEAAKKGVDPTVYKQIYETQKELERLKKEREEEIRTNKITMFVGALDNFIKSNGLSDADKEEILGAMESDGYTLDDVLAIKNPVSLFKGYAVDKIRAKIQQEEAQRQAKKRKLAEKEMKHTSKPEKEASIEELMRAYYKNKKDY